MRSTRSFLTVLTTLMLIPGEAGGINATTARPDVGGDWPEGDLPQQMGGEFKLLMPGIDDFRLPENLAQLFSKAPYEDKNPRSKTKGQMVERLVLKCDRANPLIIASGPRMGDVLTATLTSNARARGKIDNPQTVYVSDLAYLLETSLGDTSRPAGNDLLMTTLAKYAGKIVRLEHGLQGSCNPNHVVRLAFQDPVNPAAVVVAEDPTGRKGCGKRYYTSAFKNPQPRTLADLYESQIQCEGAIANPENPAQPKTCDAVIRAFPQIERFLPPVGQK